MKAFKSCEILNEFFKQKSSRETIRIESNETEDRFRQ